MIQVTDKPIEFQGHPCHVIATTYAAGGREAFELQSQRDESRWVATVNLPDELLGPDCIFVKDWSENEGMVAFLIRADIIEPEKLDEVRSGFVTIGAYRLTDAVRAKLDPQQPQDAGMERARYIVTAHLLPGITEASAPGAGAIEGALEVGSEGAPEEMLLDRVHHFEVETAPRKPIIIVVEGGVVQNVADIPPGIEVHVRDFDVDGTDDSQQHHDDNGEPYVLGIFTAEGCAERQP